LTFTCYDSIDADNLPDGGDAYLAYVDGIYENWNAVKARFPKAYLIGVAVFPAGKALMADDEPGDFTNAQVAAWFPDDAKTYARPILYTDASNMDALVAEMQATGDNRSAYRCFSAHYGWSGGAHICGPGSCNACQTQCDATQWASNDFYDTSQLSDNFFGDPVTSKWVQWTCGGEDSAMTFANASGLRVSTWLRMQIVLGGAFSASMSNYLAGGDLRATMPAGTVVWALVKS
jgi:hypothetical protein